MSAASRRLRRKRLRDAARCPDCSSKVQVHNASSTSPHVEIAHDVTCPWHRQVSRGRPFRLFVINRGGGS